MGKLVLSDVVKKYKDTIALRNVNLELEKGKRYFLLGKNGSGKSTLIDCIAGHISYTGSITYNKKVQFSREIAYQPQHFNILENLKVSEVIDFFKSSVSSYRFDQELYNFLEIASILRKKVKSLSGGQRKALSIFISLVMNKEIVILDEPLSELDFEKKKALNQYLSKNYLDKLFIVISHELEDMQLFTSDLLILDNGEVKCCGDYDSLFANYKVNTIEDVYLAVTGKTIYEKRIG
ncbi:ATP-binding cassette domain-containing protein [Streptococcus equi]|uniref:ABC transporter n=1 Tax=Streptococcus equi subsp. equi TaxID=148942 RepID=A0A380JR88_9STRE|nr:ABC transporter ATP-binding protein [Streptococcus equi]SUN47280.1 ABC transporter [Streptococcus equi subsp. equi]